MEIKSSTCVVCNNIVELMETHPKGPKKSGNAQREVV